MFATIDYLEASNYVIEHQLLTLHSITQDLKDCKASATELGNAYSLQFLPKLCYEKGSKTSKLGIYYSQVWERRAFFAKFPMSFIIACFQLYNTWYILNAVMCSRVCSNLLGGKDIFAGCSFIFAANMRILCVDRPSRTKAPEPKVKMWFF